MKKFLIITAIVCLVSFCLSGISFLIFDVRGALDVFKNSKYRSIGFDSYITGRSYRLNRLNRIADRFSEKFEDEFEDYFADGFYDGVDELSDNISDAVSDTVNNVVNNALGRGMRRYIKGISSYAVDQMLGGDGYFDKSDIKVAERNLKIIDEKKDSLDGIESIDINAKNTDIVISRGRGSEITTYTLKRRFRAGTVKTDFSKDKKALNISAKAGNVDSRIYVLIPDDFKGSINVNSKDGNLIFARVKQDLDVNLIDGDIVGEISSNSNCSLSTKDGDIVAAISDIENANASIKLSAYDGDIISTLPFEKSVSEDNREYTYKIKDGKNKIELNTSDGDIILE